MLRKFGTSKNVNDDVPKRVASVGDIQNQYSVTSMCSAWDGSIWIGCKGGHVECYSSLGQRQFVNSLHCGVSSLYCVGNRIWIGLADGQVHICTLEGSPLKFFPMHDLAVRSQQVIGSIIYSLESRGIVRGYSAWAPSVADQESWSAWLKASKQVVNNKALKILCGTWNVNETRPSSESICKWLSPNKFESADLVVVGLQEVEMGTGSVAVAAAKERVYKQWLEQGNRNAQWWASEIENALGKGWMRVGMRQLSGMLIVCMIRQELYEHVGDVLTASVACGVAGIGGNVKLWMMAFLVKAKKNGTES
eukprot:TRINITY_DN30553_c0_g1_i2.p2 TRINITY_DN30553_c0_g1~~TRINITY_DN30553_c0_g1_i2.p2  ORF type:complete len:315 (+),score=19.47 TRINITY_DN30553_c0_g1_i2:26-946(+)